METIDLNADAGESFGRWTLGADDQLVPLVTSVNVACGWHAADPGDMRRSVKLAKEHGVGLGAHPGFPDLMGFGRRQLECSHDEIVDMCVYQVGALRAFAQAEGVRLTHVKFHSKLFVTISRDEALMLKVADALTQLQSDLAIVMFQGPPSEALRKRGFTTRSELVADMEYDDDGHVIIEQRPPAKDPDYVAQRAVQIACGVLETVGGRQLKADVQTICIHGDRPNAVDIARAIRTALADASIEVAAPRQEG